ncbi:MAG: flagellar basal body rod C-terminal domain-containing protein [bacterium]
MNFSNSIQGIQNAFNRQSASAGRIAGINSGNTEDSNNQSSVDLAGEMVGQMTNRHSVALNTEVIRTQDNMLGELLDLQA